MCETQESEYWVKLIIHEEWLKAGSQYDAGPRVAMRQHAMRSPASQRSNRKQVYSRVTIHCSRDVHNCVSRLNVAQRIAIESSVIRGGDNKVRTTQDHNTTYMHAEKVDLSLAPHPFICVGIYVHVYCMLTWPPCCVAIVLLRFLLHKTSIYI